MHRPEVATISTLKRRRRVSSSRSQPLRCAQIRTAGEHASFRLRRSALTPFRLTDAGFTLPKPYEVAQGRIANIGCSTVNIGTDSQYMRSRAHKRSARALRQ